MTDLTEDWRKAAMFAEVTPTVIAEAKNEGAREALLALAETIVWTDTPSLADAADSLKRQLRERIALNYPAPTPAASVDAPAPAASGPPEPDDASIFWLNVERGGGEMVNLHIRITPDIARAIVALAALATPAPSAWGVVEDSTGDIVAVADSPKPGRAKAGYHRIPLYTHPPAHPGGAMRKPDWEGFVREMFDQEDRGDWDAGAIQEVAVKHGVLIRETWDEPCDPDHCVCAEYGDFPIECYRLAPLAQETPRDKDV